VNRPETVFPNSGPGESQLAKLDLGAVVKLSTTARMNLVVSSGVPLNQQLAEFLGCSTNRRAFFNSKAFKPAGMRGCEILRVLPFDAGFQFSTADQIPAGKNDKRARNSHPQQAIYPSIAVPSGRGRRQ
jgi:hypothetical protein